MNLRVIAQLFLMAMAVVVLWGRSAYVPAGGEIPSRPTGTVGSETFLQWQGASSCAAAACHNGNKSRGSAGSEYTTWVTDDPHARAYQSLFGKQSIVIVKNLGLQAAHQETLCLNCHVHPRYEEAKHGARFTKADGVGCESCHGPAQAWLDEHYRDGWRQRTVPEKISRGMRDTKSIEGRATACVGCHVGTPGSNVNHDLIAAGHPRLNFEFGAYHANLPRHWDDAKDKDNTKDPRGRADFEAQAWAVGQVIAAQAALELLRYRAEPGDRPWPEFAEYDCYACHHDLKADSWRQRQALELRATAPKRMAKAGDAFKRRADFYAWGTWYQAMPRVLASWPSLKDERLRESLDQLEREMNQPYPDRKRLGAKLDTSLKDLERMKERLRGEKPADAATVARRFAQLAQDPQHLVPGNWDDAVQVYLGLAALHRAGRDLGTPRNPDLAADLNALAAFLEFPARFDGRALPTLLKGIQEHGPR